jgi:hypothetical protein
MPADSLLRRRARADLEREAAGSPYDAMANDLLANVALFEGRWDDARVSLERMLAVDPWAHGAHERLGLVALRLGRPHEALVEFARERALGQPEADLELRDGPAYRALGDL